MRTRNHIVINLFHARVRNTRPQSRAVCVCCLVRRGVRLLVKSQLMVYKHTTTTGQPIRRTNRRSPNESRSTISEVYIYRSAPLALSFLHRRPPSRHRDPSPPTPSIVYPQNMINTPSSRYGCSIWHADFLSLFTRSWFMCNPFPCLNFDQKYDYMHAEVQCIGYEVEAWLCFIDSYDLYKYARIIIIMNIGRRAHHIQRTNPGMPAFPQGRQGVQFNQATMMHNMRMLLCV